MIIRHVTCYRFRLPLTAPVPVPGGRVTERAGALLRIETDAPSQGWGEASPLPGFSGETLDEAVAISRAVAREKICGRPAGEIAEFLQKESTLPPSVRFALESALHQIGDSEHPSPPADAAVMVPLCALAGGGAQTVQREVDAAVRAGYATVKIKVGRNSVMDDITMARALRRSFAGACRLRFDANRAWTFEDASRFCGSIADDEVDYVEEPLADPTKLTSLYERCGVSFAVDETLQELSACMAGTGNDKTSAREAALRAIVENARALVWKPTLGASPENMSLKTDAPVVLSGAYESGIGSAAILRLSAAGRHVAQPPGIDTYNRLDDDVLEQRLPICRGAANLQAVTRAAEKVNPAKLTQAWHV
ncbi:MAG TPA: o-succinylbenzoate synthase [Candidatus Hydrogenedentes bacterium]|nr:o-succinylbenzoate synthase [Candidatus Hydrogenedentota bacterium]